VNATDKAFDARQGAAARGGGVLPPVVVMNPYYSGLGIARSLAGRGIAVHALTWERGVPGTRSRYFRRVLNAPNGRDEPEALCQFLVALAPTFATKPVLFPTRDFDVLFLDRFRVPLAEGYLLPQPADSPIMRMMDKLELARVAATLDIAVPKTASCASVADIEREAAAMHFPLIAKPRFALQWRYGDSWQRVGQQKAFIVESIDALHALYARLAGVTPEILVQEYVPGADHDIVVCCAVAGRDGTAKGYFTGRKLRQSPPLVGTGCVVEALAVDEIVAPTMALLSAFGYSGIAEVEYKHDRASGKYYLIEINPRHWDQHELGTLVGINITWLAYADLIGRSLAPCVPEYRNGRRCRWIAERELAIDIGRNAFESVTEARPGERLAAGWRATRQALGETRAALYGTNIYGHASVRDPLPGITAGWQLVRDVSATCVGRLRKG
jgi:D-aspartate ligase